MTRRQVTKQLDAIIDYSGLGEFIDRPLRTYSTGMVARLGFSVAVHRDPEILLLDEVLSVGDSAFQSKCMDTMHGFRNKGCSIVFVSHAMGQVRNIAIASSFCGSIRLPTPVACRKASAVTSKSCRSPARPPSVNPPGIEHFLNPEP